MSPYADLRRRRRGKRRDHSDATGVSLPFFQRVLPRTHTYLRPPFLRALHRSRGLRFSAALRATDSGVSSLPFAASSFLVSAVALPVPKQSPASISRDAKVTRYERARIIGSRALQVSMGAPVLIDVPETLEGPNPVGISMREYELGLIPITVRRSVATERKRAYATSANAGPAERGKQAAKRERETS